MVDIIGDIHGYADKLELLLGMLGYSKKNNCYSHLESKAIFVGDYIDRGLQIRETLDIVKQMVDSGNAIALMGNHEYNAICFHYQESEGGHLRKHEIKNIMQHYETLKQFQNRQKEYEAYIDWFKTLPLFYETDDFRVIHACWDDESIAFLQDKLPNNRLNDNLIYQSVKKETDLHKAIDITLKGKEIKLPKGSFFTDKEGITRSEIRIKWWENPLKFNYKNICVEPNNYLPDKQVDISLLHNLDFYKPTSKPVFFGHYWCKGKPTLIKSNICCLDYSVAKHGHLVAYRYEKNEVLNKSKFFRV